MDYFKYIRGILNSQSLLMSDSVEYGNVTFFGSIFLGLISWFTPENVDLGLKIITGIGALASGFLAGRYYWYATKEKQESIKNLKEKNGKSTP